MGGQVNIPNSEKQVEVKLTIKEILALSGDKFGHDRAGLITARKKVREIADNELKSK